MPRQPAVVNYRRACQTGLNKFPPARYTAFIEQTEQEYGKETFKARQVSRRRSQRTAARPQTKTEPEASAEKSPCEEMVWTAPSSALACLFVAVSHALGTHLAAWAGGVFADQPRRGLFRIDPARGL